MSFTDKSTGASITVDVSRATDLHASNDCMLGGEPFVYVTYSSSANTYLDKLLILDDTAHILDGKWQAAPSMTDLGLDQTYSVVWTLFDYSLRKHDLLVGKKISGCCGLNEATGRCCYNNAALYQFSEDGLSRRLSFSFPTTTIVTGMSFHDDGLNLFVYGTTPSYQAHYLILHRL
jgi:hypothetical protein